MFSYVCTDPRNYLVKIISSFFKRDDSGEWGWLSPSRASSQLEARQVCVQELCLALGTVRKEMVDSKYRILSNLRNCDFVGKYSS